MLILFQLQFLSPNLRKDVAGKKSRPPEVPLGYFPQGLLRVNDELPTYKLKRVNLLIQIVTPIKIKQILGTLNYFTRYHIAIISHY